MMGSEFGQWNEWHFEQSLDWHLLDQEPHRQLQTFFRDANAFYLAHPQLWELDFTWEGFQWIYADDCNGNTLLYLRKDKKGEPLLIAVNFSPVHRKGYRVGVPIPGTYQLLLNSDDARYGGSGAGDTQPLCSELAPCHGFAESIQIDLPPLAGVIYRCSRKKTPAQLAAQARQAEEERLAQERRAEEERQAQERAGDWDTPQR
jgi:1,4-alpha-glucan branching enzyme